MTDIQSYKKLLLECRKLRGKSGENAHKRAKMLVDVFNDHDFRADLGAADDFKAAEALDIEVEDLALSFLELREMFLAFPDAKEWSDGRLATLYARTVEKRTQSSKDEDREPRKTNRVTRTQLDEEVKSRKDAEARLRNIESDRDRLLREISELRDENATLRGRILELERLLSRESAAA